MNIRGKLAVSATYCSDYTGFLGNPVFWRARLLPCSYYSYFLCQLQKKKREKEEKKEEEEEEKKEKEEDSESRNTPLTILHSLVE